MWEAEISTTTSHPVKRPSAVCSPVRRVLTLTRAWCNGQTFRLPWPPPACRSRTRHTLEATQCSPYTALLQEVPRARLSTTASLSEQPLSLVDTTSSSNAWTFRSISNSFYIATSTALATSTMPALTINPNGFLGIATSSPGSLLSIQNVGNFVASATSTLFNGLQVATLNITGLSTFGNTILTNATTTNLFSTTASSTNLFSQLATLGTLTLNNALTVANGGTGAATLTGLLQGNGTSAITGITGTAGQFPYYNCGSTLLASSSLFLAS